MGQICKYLAAKAQEKGVEIYTGFAVDEILYKDGKVIGAKTKDTGVDHHGHQLGKLIRLVRGLRPELPFLQKEPRGSLAKMLIKKFDLTKDSNEQIYSLGCKELWSVPQGNIESRSRFITPWDIRLTMMNLVEALFMD